MNTGARAIAFLLIVSSARATEPSKRECVAANEAGQDLRRAGRLRDAKQQLAMCVATACPPAVRDDCTDRLRELEKAAASIVFEVKDAQGNDLSAVSVTIDGQPLVTKLDGTAVDVDLGEHTFRLEAERQSVEKTLVIREGEKDRHERIVLPARVESLRARTATRAPAIAAFGVGGVGLIVGIVFTGVWASTDCATNDRAQICDQEHKSSQQATLVGLSAGIGIGFAVAGIGALAGTILLVTSAKPDHTSVSRIRSRFGVGWGGIEGRF